MKKIKLIVEIECLDSTCISNLVTDWQDGLLRDDVKKSTVEYEENGTLQVDEFENPDFEEEYHDWSKAGKNRFPWMW